MMVMNHTQDLDRIYLSEKTDSAVVNGENMTEKGPVFTVSDKYQTVLVTESISNRNGIMSTLVLI